VRWIEALEWDYLQSRRVSWRDQAVSRIDGTMQSVNQRDREACGDAEKNLREPIFSFKYRYRNLYRNGTLD